LLSAATRPFLGAARGATELRSLGTHGAMAKAYGTVRLHSSLGYRPPALDAAQHCPNRPAMPPLPGRAERNESMTL